MLPAIRPAFIQHGGKNFSTAGKGFRLHSILADNQSRIGRGWTRLTLGGALLPPLPFHNFLLFAVGVGESAVNFIRNAPQSYVRVTPRGNVRPKSGGREQRSAH